MRRFPISRRGLLTGSTALALAAAAQPRWARAADAKTLKVRTGGDLQILDPAYILADVELDINSCIMAKLIKFKAADVWEWELDAAQSIEQVDTTHVTFTLRPGITWSNGFGELTAEDVKFSFERIADPNMESPYVEDWQYLERVEITDRYSGVITLKQPYAPLFTSTLPWTSGTIVSKKAVESVGGKYTTDPVAMCGPYVIKKWVPEQRTVLARNPEWTGPQPAFDEVHIFPIVDEKTAELGFLAGDLDYTKVALSSVPTLKAQLGADATLIEKPSLRYSWMGINADNPQLQDIRVRKAIQTAVDVDAIMEAAFFDVAKPSTGIIAPGLIGHRGYNLTKFDPEEARRLLAEAGYAGGFKATIDILNTTQWVTVAQVIQSNLAEIGVDLEINIHEPGMFWTLGMESEGDAWKDIQLVLSEFVTAPDPGWTTMWFTSYQVGVWNWERFTHPDFDGLHDAALLELAPEKRHEMYLRLQDLMEGSGSYLFLTHGSTPILYRNTIVPAVLPDGTPLYAEFRLA